jgi:hypothetical protein
MNYIFYRIYSYYERKKYIPTAMGIYFMTILMFALIFSLVSIMNITADNLLSPQNLEPSSYKFFTFAIISGVLGGNAWYYGRKNKVEKIVQKYSTNPLNRKLKTWMIFAIIPFIFIFTIWLLVNFSKNN